VDVDVSHVGILSVDDLGQLLESRTTSLDVHEIDEN
jgi:hypothetical protein